MAEFRKTTDAELDLAFAGPAVHANRFYATIMPGGLRLTFAEQHAADALGQFRAAVFLSPQDAVALFDLLKRVLEDTGVAAEAKPDSSKKDG